MAIRNSGYLTMKTRSAAFYSVLLIMALGLTVEAQNRLIANRYLDIIPGVSTKENVERRFPEARAIEFDGKHMIDFRVGDLVVGITYSIGKCGAFAIPDWGKFPEWTVIEVMYSWWEDSNVRINEVILDKRRFKKTQTSDVIVHVDYRNAEAGLMVTYNTKHKFVEGIKLTPALAFNERYQCKNTWGRYETAYF